MDFSIADISESSVTNGRYKTGKGVYDITNGKNVSVDADNLKKCQILALVIYQ